MKYQAPTALHSRDCQCLPNSCFLQLCLLCNQARAVGLRSWQSNEDGSMSLSDLVLDLQRYLPVCSFSDLTTSGAMCSREHKHGRTLTNRHWAFHEQELNFCTEPHQLSGFYLQHGLFYSNTLCREPSQIGLKLQPKTPTLLRKKSQNLGLRVHSCQ